MTQKICFLSLLISCSGFAQPEADSTQLQRAVQHTLGVYRQTMQAQSGLYNGSRYRPPPHDLDHHPYFHSVDWISGDVRYDGILFTGVPLMYDMLSGYLIIEHFGSGQPIQLILPRVEQFTLAGHHFRKFDSASSGGSLRGKEFYDVLYGGPTTVIARRHKTMHKQVFASRIEITFDEKARYYIFKHGVFFHVRSKSSVLGVLGDEKKNLKKQLRKTPLPPDGGREKLLVTLATLYDTIKASKQ